MTAGRMDGGEGAMEVVDVVSDVWPCSMKREHFRPGALLEPQPTSSVGAFATQWHWRDLEWTDGHLPPAPVEQLEGGWRWAGLMAGRCIPCKNVVTLVRRGSAYVCARCRAYVPSADAIRVAPARPKEV